MAFDWASCVIIMRLNCLPEVHETCLTHDIVETSNKTEYFRHILLFDYTRAVDRCERGEVGVKREGEGMGEMILLDIFYSLTIP